MNLHAQGVVLICVLMVGVRSVLTRQDPRTVRQYSRGPSSHTIIEQTFATNSGTKPLDHHTPYHRQPPENDVPKSYKLISTLAHDMFREHQAQFKRGQEYGEYYPQQDENNYNTYDKQNQQEKSHLACLILGICATLVPPVDSSQKHEVLRTFLEWVQLEFDYDNELARQADIDSGFYIRNIPVPIDVDVKYEQGGKSSHKLFLAIPRFQVGSPITLGQVLSYKRVNNTPVVSPYPSWSWHRNPNECKTDRLISVYRVKIDQCGRLWVLDTGKYGDNQTCLPQLIAFDLETDQVVFRMEIATSFIESRSILVTPVVDVRDSCSDVFVYLADCQVYSIIVVDVANRAIWRATDKTMYPFPDEGTYNIAGDTFQLMDGILGMAMQPYVPGRDPKLFYQAMSSKTLNWVYTSTLRNHSIFPEFGLSTETSKLFHVFKSRRPSQSCALAIDRNGISYFGLMNEISMNCWNTKNDDYGKHIGLVEQDSERLQFASGVKVITNLNNEQELWVLSSSFQKLMAGTLSTTKHNFRISGAKISSFISKTSCQQPNGSYNHRNNYG